MRLIFRAIWAGAVAGVLFGLLTIPFDGTENALSEGFWFAVFSVPAFVVILVIDRKGYRHIARRVVQFLKPSP